MAKTATRSFNPASAPTLEEAHAAFAQAARQSAAKPGKFVRLPRQYWSVLEADLEEKARPALERLRDAENLTIG